MGFEGLKPTTNTEQQPPKVETVSDNQIKYEKTELQTLHTEIKTTYPETNENTLHKVLQGIEKNI